MDGILREDARQATMDDIRALGTHLVFICGVLMPLLLLILFKLKLSVTFCSSLQIRTRLTKASPDKKRPEGQLP